MWLQEALKPVLLRRMKEVRTWPTVLLHLGGLPAPSRLFIASQLLIIEYYCERKMSTLDRF